MIFKDSKNFLTKDFDSYLIKYYFNLCFLWTNLIVKNLILFIKILFTMMSLKIECYYYFIKNLMVKKCLFKSFFYEVIFRPWFILNYANVKYFKLFFFSQYFCLILRDFLIWNVAIKYFFRKPFFFIGIYYI